MTAETYSGQDKGNIGRCGWVIRIEMYELNTIKSAATTRRNGDGVVHGARRWWGFQPGVLRGTGSLGVPRIKYTKATNYALNLHHSLKSH